MSEQLSPQFTHEHWMREAIAEAKKAEAIAEVPIGAVIVRNGEIIGVHAASDSSSIPPYEPREILDYPDSMLMPGLINAHTHAAMALMRGFGDDLKLTDW